MKFEYVPTVNDPKMHDWVIKNMNAILKSVHYTPTVYAEIFGKSYDLDEAKVRALQYLFKTTFEIAGEEAYQKLKKNVLVFNNSSKDNSTELMDFRRDGIFYNDFYGHPETGPMPKDYCGFGSANSSLAFKLL